MDAVANQFKCECGLLVKPAEVDASSEACPSCGTDAPLLWADADGAVVSYRSSTTPEMAAALREMVE